MSKYPKHDSALKWAAKELGTTEHPDGSNMGQRVQEYQHATWLGGTGWPWCAAFVCWVWQKAGFVLSYKGAGAYAWYDDGAQHVGRKIPRDRPDQVVPGDAVVFSIGQGHIGLVEKILDGAVHSIDGNTSDMVARRVRSLGLVYGFVHIDEKAVTPPGKPPKPPTYEVVTGESGSIVVYSGGDIAHVTARLKAILRRYPAGVTIRRRPK